MKKNVLLKRVNEYAYKAYGICFTGRMLSDMVNEDLIPQAAPFGRTIENPRQNWEWDDNHYHRVMQICDLMGAGIKRKSALRIELWFSGVDIPADLLLKDFHTEFRRLRKKRMKPIKSGFDPEKDRHMPPRQKKALMRQMGGLPPELNIPISEFSEDQKLKMLQKFGWGDPKTDINFYPEKLIEGMGINDIIKSYFFNFEKLTHDSMANLFGDPKFTEDNAENIIQKIAFEELIATRKFFYICQPILENLIPLIRALAPETKEVIDDFQDLYSFTTKRIKRGEGRLEFFVALLILMKRDPEMADKIKIPLQNFLAGAIPAAQSA